MPLNANIILEGQQPNLVNALAQGARAASQANKVQDQNALRDLYRTQGAGITQGNPQALNALAGLNPGAALDVQKSRLGMDQTRQSMAVQRETQARLSREEKRVIEDRAAAMTKAERDATIAQIQTGLSELAPLYSRGDEAAYSAKLQQLDLDPNEYGFQNFESKAAKFEDVLGVLKAFDERNAEPKPADEYGRYAQEEAKAGRKPLSRIDYAQAKKGDGLSITTSDGTTITQGKSPTAPKLTVDAARNAGFLIRTQDANGIINSLEDQGTKFFQQNLEGVPMGLGNYARTEEFQKFDQARRDFINAILRRESGAVISDSEFENGNIQYFPVPGDGPEVIAQKRNNRENAIKGLRVGSGAGAGYVDQLEAQEAPPTQGGGSDLPTGPSDADIEAYWKQYGGGQ